jgi:hypothetical protein
MVFKRLVITALLLIAGLSLYSQESGRHIILTDFNLTPNPFSPYSEYSVRAEERGLRISFKVETHSTFIWITARVFNTRGQLIRTVKEWEPIYGDKQLRGPDDEPLTEINLWWDGYTEFGRMADNGRYILHLHVSDTEARTFSVEKTKPFVLIK